MALARTLGVVALAALGILTMGGAIQWSQSGSYSGAAVNSDRLVDRFAAPLLVGKDPSRTSVAIAQALPPAPDGWTAGPWQADHDTFLYSPSQLRALEHELTRATLGLPDTRQSSRRDLADFEAYQGDTSIAYRDGHGVIALSVRDAAHEIAHPVWRARLAAITAHFERVDTLIEHETLQDVTWYEVHGPVETALNTGRPHRLRSFAARIDGVELYLATRTADARLTRFLETLDLDGVRRLAGAEAGVAGHKQPLKQALIPQARPPATKQQVRINRGLD